MISNTLAEVPNNIENMLKNYKKVAIINPNLIRNLTTDSPFDFKIPVSLGFTPNRVLVKIILRQNYVDSTMIYDNAVIDSKYHNADNITADRNGHYINKPNSWKEPNFLMLRFVEVGASIISKSNSQIIVRFASDRNMITYDVKIQEIIAIG